VTKFNTPTKQTTIWIVKFITVGLCICFWNGALNACLGDFFLLNVALLYCLVFKGVDFAL
jgi:hypothetical protein